MYRRFLVMFSALVTIFSLTEQHRDHSNAVPPRGGLPNNLIEDEQHVLDHLKEELGDRAPESVNRDESDFYYFHTHDTNKDNRLDGLEIFNAFSHMMPSDEDLLKMMQRDGENIFGGTAKTLVDIKREAYNFLTEYVDKLLKHDEDNDGYLNYVEFASGRRRDGD